MMRTERLRHLRVVESSWVLLLLYGALRFAGALRLAFTGLRGDFAAVFPTPYFARLRPDFPTDAVWAGWGYGPMLHFLTLPLFAVPRWWMVPIVWGVVNLACVCIMFGLVLRIADPSARMPRRSIGLLAALWLLYQPLNSCLAQGNIEIVEMTLVVAAIVLLPRWRGSASGALIGAATMLKLLPVGFVAWFLIRRRWRAALIATATIIAIAAVTSVTLGWDQNFSVKDVAAVRSPLGGFQSASVTSIFMHWAGMLDYSMLSVRWLPAGRFAAASDAGLVTSLLIATGYAILLIVRRRSPVTPLDISVLFMAMFMVLPWSHTYYYVFALVPLSVLFSRALTTSRWTLLTATAVSYVLISPPVPYQWIDHTGWLSLPFELWTTYYNVPTVGGLVLWGAVTYELFGETREIALVRWPAVRTVRTAGVTAAVTVGGVAALWFASGSLRASPTQPTFQPQILVTGRAALALSPDGSRLAYVARTPHGSTLCVRALTDVDAACLPDTTDAAAPVFSPDGRWVAFFADGFLKRMPAMGGPAAIITASADGESATWSDDMITYASPLGIFRVSAAGGMAQFVLPVWHAGVAYHWPTMAPSGDTVFFTQSPVNGSAASGTIVAHSLRTGREAVLTHGTQPSFDRASRRLIYADGGRVLAAPFDPDSLTFSGAAVPIASDVLTTPSGGAQFAIAARGMLIYAAAAAGRPIQRSLVWVDRRGLVTPVAVPHDAYETPRVAPDGHQIAVVVRDAVEDVWTYSLDGTGGRRVTSSSISNHTPVWTPDGRSLSYVAADEYSSVRLVRSDSAEAPSTMWDTRIRPSLALTSWSPDSRFLVGSTGRELWMLDARHPSRVVTHTRASGAQRDGVVSPDGHWIAYTSDESRRDEVYVASFPEMFDAHRVSTNGGNEPMWKRDGRELFYRQGDAMMAVGVTLAKTSFAAGTPTRIFTGPYLRSPRGTNYDVSSDGQRFLMIAPPTTFPQDIRIVADWRSVDHAAR